MAKPRNLVATFNTEREQRGAQRRKNLPAAWNKRIEQFQWYPRAEAYDQHELARESQEREADRQRRLAQKLQDEADQRHREIEDGRILREKALAVLQLPHVLQKRTRREGELTEQIEIKPARSAEFYAATKMLETANTFTRRALDMPQETRKVEIDWKQEAQRYGVDPESLINTLAVLIAEQVAPGGTPEDRAGGDDGSLSPHQNGTG